MNTIDDRQSSLILSCERFFRIYFEFCVKPSDDTLFNFLNSAHSLNDKFIKYCKDNFFDDDEFIALKALRNYFHHHEEIENKFKFIPIRELPNIQFDLYNLCLINCITMDKAIECIDKKFQNDHKNRINNVLKYHKNIVDIYPCVFNFVVKVYEKIVKNQIIINTLEFNELKSSYEYEEKNNISHFTNGSIRCLPSDAKNVEDIIFGWEEK